MSLPTTSQVNGGGCFGNQSSDATTPLDLSPETITAIAERVAEMLTNGVPGAQSTLVDAQTVARKLGVSRDSVYRHATELGGHRVGDGPRGPLRFDLDRALSAWNGRLASERSQGIGKPAAAAVSRARRRGSLGSSRTLLPVHGDLSENGGA
jgi:hypothetical protein